MNHSFLLTVLLSLAPAGWLSASERPASTAAFEAVLRPAVTIELSTTSVGVLESVSVERGDRVAAGQVLAVLESGLERADLAVLRARAESTAAVETARIQHVRSSARRKQAEQLSRDGIVSAEELERARAEEQLAELALLQAREEKDLAQLEYLRAQQLLEQRSLRSPFGGVVVERLLSPGELVDRSRNAIVFELAQLDELVLDVRVPHALALDLVPGRTALVDLAAPENRTVTGVVSIVDPIVDAATGTRRVRVTLPNPKHTIPPGLHVRVRL